MNNLGFVLRCKFKNTYSYFCTILVAIALLASIQVAYSQQQSSSTKKEPAMKNKDFIENIIMKERAGIRNYKKGEYQKAYKDLRYAAKRGFKQSQYLIGLMYLKGQHVKPSLFYGMAWLGVAKEAGSKEWVALFEQIYTNATLEQRAAIDTNMKKFIEKYGLKAQDMTCSNRSRLGNRKKTLECTKNTKVFEINRSRTEETILNNRF